MDKGIPLKVEFTYVRSLTRHQMYHPLTERSGGLEMLFSNQREHRISIPALDGDKRPSNVAFLIQYLCDNLMKDPRKAMFVIDDSV